VGAAAVGIFACRPSGDDSLTATAEPLPELAVNNGRRPGEAFIVQPVDGYDPKTQWAADYTMYADWISTGYDPQNVRFFGGRIILNIEKRRIERQPYSGAEFQRAGFYGYGRYEVVMRPSNRTGVISSFFTHTDDYHGDPHDEIDFEFLGKNKREVQLNYFSGGVAGGPFNIVLPFEASKADHLYAFDWSPSALRWYIDGHLVKEVLAPEARVPLPRSTQRVIVNIWTAAGDAAKHWAGLPKFTAANASYACMSHVPLGKTGAQCSDKFKPPILSKPFWARRD